MRWLALFVCLLGGCTTHPYCLDCITVVDGGEARDAGADGSPEDAPSGPGDGAPCVPTGAETCDGKDNDCNGTTDEGPLAGEGMPCSSNIGACRPGVTGCVAGTIACTGGAVLPKAEECNGIDDDCDGRVDDGDPGGGVSCGSGVGDCVKGMTACVDGTIQCEREIAPVPEACDGHDNDCDGVLDEGNPGGGAPCGDRVGSCVPGVLTCVGGALRCLGDSGPTIEKCDLGDNDCDGMIDEDFNLMSDVRNCGACGHICTVENGLPACVAGNCKISICVADFWDKDGRYETGCEYRCTFKGDEICNGVDDDCDGSTDEGLVPPAVCQSAGECAGTVATCAGAGGWTCQYGDNVSKDGQGNIVSETSCDGKDNDCDGETDEAFPQKGQPCSNGTGACRTQGNLACNATLDGIVCNAPPALSPKAETCNGLDDDCNGILDDGAPDRWVKFSGSFGTRWIYAYEASRPDASASSVGTLSHRPCSASGRLPWANVTQPQAEAACKSLGTGVNLCTEAEWQRACETASSSACSWSFDTACTTYAPTKCNGNDYDSDPILSGDQDSVLPTGQLPLCHASWSGERIYDLSGNLKEWARARKAGVNPLRGGSYNNTSTGIGCGFDFVVTDDVFQFANVGFRCCRSTAP